MDDSDKSKLQLELKNLIKEKEEVITDIRDLDWAKIIKLEKENEELQKKVDWLDKDKKKTDRENKNLSRQFSNAKPKMWWNSLKIIAFIGIINLIAIPIIITLLKLQLGYIFMGIGIITFFGILLLTNYMSWSSSYNTGEIRKAITSALVTVYLIVIPINVGNTESTPAIFYFTILVGIVVVCYFVSRSLEEYMKIKYENKS